jgi:hypothetical protein
VLRPVLQGGPPARGRVVGVFGSAVYLELAAAAAAPEILALETYDALRLPCAVVLADRSAARPFRAVRPGQRAAADGRGLTVGPLRVEVVRWWAPRRPRRGAADGHAMRRLRALLPAPDPALARAGAPLAEWLARPGRGGCRDAVVGLVGLGDGLTPAGDDVLAGALVALAARPGAQQLGADLGAEVRAHAPGRTTALSAALLRHAAGGLGVAALLDVVDRLTHPGGTGLDRAVVRLLAVGHSSGAALAHGVSLAGLAPATLAARKVCA